MSDPNQSPSDDTAPVDSRTIAEHVLSELVREDTFERHIDDTITSAPDGDTVIIHPGDRVVIEYELNIVDKKTEWTVVGRHDVTDTTFDFDTTTRFFVEAYVDERVDADTVSVTGPKVIAFNITAEAVMRISQLLDDV